MHGEEQEKKTATISTIYALIVKIRERKRNKKL